MCPPADSTNETMCVLHKLFLRPPALFPLVFAFHYQTVSNRVAYFALAHQYFGFLESSLFSIDILALTI